MPPNKAPYDSGQSTLATTLASHPMNSLRFTKMHGLGNDFMVVDGVRQQVALDTAQIRRLADRHVGIGFDQLLLLETPRRPEAQFAYRIFNADGGEVGQCGNGARCAAVFLREQRLAQEDVITVDTAAGLLRLTLEPRGVRVNMGRPAFTPAEVPFLADHYAPRQHLQLDGQEVSFAAIGLGNPHAVLEVADVAAAPVGQLGPQLERHPRFPARVNVSFMQIVDDRHIRLRVFERGAGETLACGSGACAAVVAGRLWGRLAPEVEVALPGGSLTVVWEGAAADEDAPVWLIGPATTVFTGEVPLPIPAGSTAQPTTA